MSACPWCGDSPHAPIAARWERRFAVEYPSAQNGNGRGGRLSNAGAARWAYRRVRDQWESLFLVWAATCGVDGGSQPRRPNARRRVTVTRHWGARQRAFDADNLRVAGKPLVDALVRAGWLADDSSKHAVIHYCQARAQHGIAAVSVLIEQFAE